ncbi:MAG: hemerythrin domain-containing protein [Thiobacillaceae bacterium]
MKIGDVRGEIAPGFDQPLGVLLACHGRIEKQCATLEKLLRHLPQHGSDVQAQQAARAILNYFDTAAVHHHDDEERNLFPLLERAGGGEWCDLVEPLTREHDDLAQLWRALHPPLQALAQGVAPALNAALVERFIALNRSHLEFENERVLPLAKQILSAADLEQLGRAMAARRGVAFTPVL